MWITIPPVCSIILSTYGFSNSWKNLGSTMHAASKDTCPIAFPGIQKFVVGTI
ncbi:MAG TPA: hypothetical protein GXX37_00070 [Clostridiaceae bacterium]|nr:hypothetical protein [Clostridiaceae bacterium]